MRTDRKRFPAFEDTDRISFGKYEGEPLSDVPAHYIRWLWESAEYKNYSKHYTQEQVTDLLSRNTSYDGDRLINKIKLANYIYNSKDALEQELKDTFI